MSDGDSWESRLQAIVDEASGVLGRPVVVEDRHVRLLAHTKHGEDEVDRTRLQLLMKQPLPAERIEWLQRYGLWSCEAPIRIPPNERLGFDARVVAPIRSQGHHLGSLCCTDRDQTMTDADLERMRVFADEAAVVLYRKMLLSDLDRSRERELLRDILSDDEDIRSEAAWRLADFDLFSSSGRVVVLVIPLSQPDDARSPENGRLAVETVLMRIRRHLAPKHGLHLLRPTHALILASLADPGIRAAGIREFALRVHGEVVESLGRGAGNPQIVAIGSLAPAITGAAESYAHALRAADAAARVSTFGEVVSWDDLGIYQMLTELPTHGLGENALHHGLRRLLEDPRSHDLLETLERYLDLAGDVQQTAGSLFLHRTTLYHRLRRIERITDTDLSRGDDRLALHLSLKLARLQRRTWSTDARQPSSKIA